MTAQAIQGKYYSNHCDRPDDRQPNNCWNYGEAEPLLQPGDAQHLAKGYLADFVSKYKLLPPGATGELAFWTEGEGQRVVVFCFLRVNDFKHHRDGLQGGTVVAGFLSRRLHGHEPGLVQSEVVQSLTLGGELELFLILFALVFSRRENLCVDFSCLLRLQQQDCKLTWWTSTPPRRNMPL